MWSKIILGAGCMGLVLSCFHGGFAEEKMTQVAEPNEKVALESARAWLKIMDEGRYEQCWEISGTDSKERFIAMFTNEQAAKAGWSAMLEERFQSYKGVASRRLREKYYFNSVLPDWPNGEYFLFAFDVVSKSGREAEEWVSVKKEKDGQWRLNSYIIGLTDKQRELMMKKYPVR